MYLTRWGVRIPMVMVDHNTSLWLDANKESLGQKNKHKGQMIRLWIRSLIPPISLAGRDTSKYQEVSAMWRLTTWWFAAGNATTYSVRVRRFAEVCNQPNQTSWAESDAPELNPNNLARNYSCEGAKLNVKAPTETGNKLTDTRRLIQGWRSLNSYYLWWQRRSDN